MGDFESKFRPVFESLLAPGETIDGVCACSQQKGLFSGGAVAVGVTSQRLLVQPLSRRGDPDGEPQSLRPADIASAKTEGAGGGWAEITAAIMDGAAIKLTLKLADGEKLRLMMMRGEGRLSGGESQKRGVQALAAWFERSGQSGSMT